MKPGMQILCADGSIVLEVVSADPSSGTVRARCLNNATLGYSALFLLLRLLHEQNCKQFCCLSVEGARP